jgi:ribosome recycling factor
MSNYTLLQGDGILEKYKKQISSLHSGRVNSSLLDNLRVDAYGSKLTIKEVATITVPEPIQLLITPFDKGLIQAISKAVRDSSLGVNPSDDGAGVRLRFPPLTEETRKARVKELHKMQEEARKDVRVNRQDVLKDNKKLKEEGLLSEDELKSIENDLQKEVDKLNSAIEEMTKNKEQEIIKI